MPKFKVYVERTKSYCAIIEAKTKEEAEKLADENYSDYNWSDVDGTLNTEICFGGTEKEIEE